MERTHLSDVPVRAAAPPVALMSPGAGGASLIVRSGSGTSMGIVSQHRPLQVGAPRRLWLIVSAVIAFLLAVLWAQPTG